MLCIAVQQIMPVRHNLPQQTFVFSQHLRLRNPEASWLGGPGPQCHEAAVSWPLGCGALKAGQCAAWLLAGLHHPRAPRLRPSFPCNPGLCTGLPECPQDVTTGSPQNHSSRRQWESPRRKPHSFLTQSENQYPMISAMLYWAPGTAVGTVWREWGKTGTPGRGNQWGPPLKLAITTVAPRRLEGESTSSCGGLAGSREDSAAGRGGGGSSPHTHPMNRPGLLAHRSTGRVDVAIKTFCKTF